MAESKQGGAGAFGPYERHNRDGSITYRLFVRTESGGKAAAQSFASRDEALRIKDEINGERETSKGRRERTIGNAIHAYEAHLRAAGRRSSSYVETPRRLRLFFADDIDMALRDLGPRRCKALYEDLCTRPALKWVGSKEGRRLVESDEPLAPTSQRGVLTHTKTFLSWCVAQRWLRYNPLAEVKPTGKLAHGKRQPRVDEGRLWRAKALELAPKHAGAVAALCALDMALRASEIVSRQVRDLDDEGRILWIDSTESFDPKTEASRRHRPVPDELRPLLLALCKDRQGNPRPRTDLLFAEKGKRGAHRRGWILFWTQKICGLVGMPSVTAHGLRGFHATLRSMQGEAANVIAQALGQAGTAVTKSSYIAPGSGEAAGQQAALKVLRGGKK